MSTNVVIAWGALAAFVITAALVPVSISVAKRLGAIDQPGERRVHRVATTRMGGIALFFGIVIPLGVIFALSGAGIVPDVLPSDTVYLPGVLLGMVVMFITGCIDDVKQIRIRWKLLGQIAAAIIVAASGIMLGGLKTYSGDPLIDFGFMGWPITVFWLVSFANVVNLIDGLDGLAAGVVGISAASLMVLAISTMNWATALCAAVLLASCVAFLFFNFHPAKLFMGDSGSLTLGFTLGIISLLGVMKVSTITSFIVPVIIAAVPVLDTASAIVRRSAKHSSIGDADKEHIHHSLLRLGFNQRSVVLTIYALCILFAISGVIIVRSGFAVRAFVMVVDFLVAVYLVWHLKLFGGVLAHFYERTERSEQWRQANEHGEGDAKAADGQSGEDGAAKAGEGSAKAASAATTAKAASAATTASAAAPANASASGPEDPTS